jgi:hypothetical protein
MPINRPLRCAIIGGANARYVRSVPVRFVSRMRCQSASFISSVGTRLVMPAALTTMSTRPNVLSTSSRTRTSDSPSDTSEVMRRVRRRRASISPATSSTSVCRRAVATTSAPASASPSASVRPMPLVPPTTTAVRPWRSNRERAIRAGLGASAWDLRAASLIRPLLYCAPRSSR